MTRLNLKNNSFTTLTEAITNSATSFTVVDGSVLPDAPFLLTILDSSFGSANAVEVIEVGAKSGNTLSSVLRGREGTTAVAHNAGVRVEVRFTAGIYDELVTTIDGKANTSHGNHVPATQTANNAIFLRNDNTWQTITPANIGASPGNHNHDASSVNSGTFADARIPSLDAGKITTGTFADARIPNLNMSKITAGSLDTTRLSEPAFVTASITRTARPLFDVLRADRTAFLPASQIIIERSTDGGVTWEDHQVSDVIKRRFFTGQRPSITIPLKNGVRSCDCMIRITITAMRYNVPGGTIETQKYNFWNSSSVLSVERYFAAMEGWVWLTSVVDRIYCRVERATGANSAGWILDREAFMSGWSGGNYFQLSGSTFGGDTTQTGNAWNWRFTFRTATTSNDFDNAKLSTSWNTSAQTLHHMKITGQNVWTSSNNYMYHDRIYNWDEDQNTTFPARVTATQLFEGAQRVYSPNNNNIGTGATNYSAGNHNHDSAYTITTVSATAPTTTKAGDIWIIP